jgi:hypothetical protein
MAAMCWQTSVSGVRGPNTVTLKNVAAMPKGGILRFGNSVRKGLLAFSYIL